MSKAELSIAYKGKALDEGTMDARELATALQAISELCEAAHRVINRDNRKISVHVKSDFKSGSFDVGLLVELLPPLLESVTIVFEDEDVFEDENVYKTLEYIGFRIGKRVVINSLIGLILFLRGRKPSKIEDNGDSYTVHAKKEEDTSKEEPTVNVPPAVLKMYEDKPVRDSLEKAVSPLQRDGIDTFEARDEEGKTTATVKKDEREYFAYKSEDDYEGEEVERKVLLRVDTSELTKPSERKFTFSRLERTMEKRKEKFTAIIIDRDYLAKIESGEISFYHGLQIEATIITTHEVVDGKRRARYEIDDVKHDVQRRLF